MASDGISTQFTAGAVANDSKPQKIDIYDTSKYEIVTVEGFGSDAKLEAFKAAFGHADQSVEEFLVSVATSEVETGTAHPALAPANDGFADVRQNIANLQEGHAALARYFPEDELETLEGFVGIMLRNSDAEMQEKYVGFREKLMFVKSKENGDVVGGTNFGMFVGNNAAENNAVTTHAVYTFVPPEYRRMGMAGSLANMRFTETHAFAAEKGVPDADVFVFSEQNSPLKMTPIEYVEDTAMAIDPVDRLKTWQRVGYMKTGFTYVQPSLGEGLDAVEMLDLHTHIEPDVRAHYGEVGLKPAVVKEHLRMFMELSVLKEEGSFAQDEYCVAMAKQLDGLKTVTATREDMEPLQKKIYAFFALMEEGKLPDPAQNAAFYERPFSEVFADKKYAGLINERATRITPDDVARIRDGIQGKGEGEVAQTGPANAWGLNAA